MNNLITPPSPVTQALPSEEERLRALWKNLPPEVRARYADRAEGRLPSIKPYQLEDPAVTALVGSAINGGCPGSGKTLMAIFHAFLKNAYRTCVITPTRVMNVWAKECARVKIPCVFITSATDAIAVSEKLWADRQAGKKPTGIVFYLVSWEWLSLGGESNMVLDPWYARLPIDLDCNPMHSHLMMRFRSYEAFETYVSEEHREEIKTWVESTMVTRLPSSPDAIIPDAIGQETFWCMYDQILLQKIRAAKARETNSLVPMEPIDFRPIWNHTGFTGRREDYPSVRLLCDTLTAETIAARYRATGLALAKGSAYRYEAHHSSCPVCQAKTPIWKGTHCSDPACRYDARSYRSKPRVEAVRTRGSRERRLFTSDNTSNRSYPGYRLLPKFDLKCIDEFHKAVSLKTVHGCAIFDVEADHTLLLSGTIVRSYITELEPALALVHDQNSPEFPYARHNLSDFRDRFKTEEVRLDITENGRVRIAARSVVPEASNVNALRRLLHPRMVAVPDEVVEREWDLKPTPQRAVTFRLGQDAEHRYVTTVGDVLSWRQRLLDQLENGSPEERAEAQRALLRGARNRLDMLSAITNGPEKVEATVNWVKEECFRQGHRVVVACRSVELFKRLEAEFKKQRFGFTVLDERVTNEERDAFLDEFAASKSPGLLTRIKLVAEAFNQLVCCDRELMCEVERSPSDNRQFQKRINRPGQRKEVRCDYLVARLSSGQASLDEIEIRRFLRKERAIKQVTGRSVRFRGAAALLRAAQEKRGVLQVLEDLSAKVISEYKPEEMAMTETPPSGSVLGETRVDNKAVSAATEVAVPTVSIPAITPPPVVTESVVVHAPQAATAPAEPPTPPPVVSFKDLFDMVPVTPAQTKSKHARRGTHSSKCEYVQAELGLF